MCIIPTSPKTGKFLTDNDLEELLVKLADNLDGAIGLVIDGLFVARNATLYYKWKNESKDLVKQAYEYIGTHAERNPE